MLFCLAERVGECDFASLAEELVQLILCREDLRSPSPYERLTK